MLSSSQCVDWEWVVKVGYKTVTGCDKVRVRGYVECDHHGTRQCVDRLEDQETMCNVASQWRENLSAYGGCAVLHCFRIHQG